MTNLLDMSTLQADIREVAVIFHHIHKSTDTNTPKGKLTFKYTPKTINIFMNDVHVRRFVSGQFHVSAIDNLCTYLTDSELVKTSGYWQVISTTDIEDKKMIVYSTPDDDISIQYDGIEVRRIVNPEDDYQDIIDQVIEEYKEYYAKQDELEQDELEQDVVVTATFPNFLMLQCCLDKVVDLAMFDTLSVDKEHGQLTIGIKMLWIDETIEAMNRANATSIVY